MNTDRLRQNIIDVVQEGQIKLGYRKETIRLYYPLASLCTFMGETMDENRMQRELEAFAAAQRDTLGALEITHKGERFCIAVPPEGAAYVHGITDKSGFLTGFIRTIERHGATMEELLDQFRRCSDRVHVEELHNGEFDYLVYFEDGVPDDFRYCIAVEPCHLTYHRFTREDYEAFGF
ncbi:MAG: DUF3877 family protein [Clostridia bacterium]|nr:DUF3877 family protein [Clostridia bacterium]